MRYPFGTTIDVGQINIQLDWLSRRERLDLVVRVPRPVRERFFLVELAMRGAQPPLRDRCVRIERALEHHFAILAVEDAHDREYVGVGCRR